MSKREELAVERANQRRKLLLAIHALGPMTAHMAAVHSGLAVFGLCPWKRVGELKASGFVEWLRRPNGAVVKEVNPTGQKAGVYRTTSKGRQLAATLKRCPAMSVPAGK